MRLYTSRLWRRSFTEGTKVSLKVGDEKQFKACLLSKDEELVNVRQNSYPETWSYIGTVAFEKVGNKILELSIDTIGTYSRLGFFGEDIQNESENNVRVMRIELIKRNREDYNRKLNDLQGLRKSHAGWAGSRIAIVQ